jgi:hypothetical protein
MVLGSWLSKTTTILKFLRVDWHAKVRSIRYGRANRPGLADNPPIWLDLMLPGIDGLKCPAPAHRWSVPILI